MIDALQFLPCAEKHGIISLAVSLFLVSAPGMAAGQSGRTDPDHEYRGNPSLVTILSVLVTFVIIIGFLFLYLLYCLKPRSGESVPLRVLQPQPGTAAHGLDAAAIEALPRFVYADVKGLKIGQGALECAVCLNEFEDDDKLCLLPRCEHVYHTHCIGTWLQTHTTCPVCRDDLAAQHEDPTQDVETLTQIETETQNLVSQTLLDPHVITLHKGKSTRGNSSGVARVKFPRSHSTGHSLVQPDRSGEDTERFRLRLPAEVRKQMLAGEGSSRRTRRLSKFHAKSDRWLFLKTSSFRWRSLSMKAPKVAAVDGEGTSVQPAKPDDSARDSVHLPV